MKKDIMLGVVTLLTLVGAGYMVTKLLPDIKECEEKEVDHNEEATEQ